MYIYCTSFDRIRCDDIRLSLSLSSLFLAFMPLSYSLPYPVFYALSILSRFCGVFAYLERTQAMDRMNSLLGYVYCIYILMLGVIFSKGAKRIYKRNGLMARDSRYFCVFAIDVSGCDCYTIWQVQLFPPFFGLLFFFYLSLTSFFMTQRILII